MIKSVLKDENFGISLIEMLVVIAILGLVTTAFVASGLRPKNTSLSSLALQMQTDLRATRTRAILSGSPTKLLFHPKQHRYQSENGKISRKMPETFEFILTTAKIGKGPQNLASIPQIQFYPDGSSSGGTLTLSKQGRNFSINTNWLTGATTLKKEMQ